jgi:hypothetical protein
LLGCARPASGWPQADNEARSADLSGTVRTVSVGASGCMKDEMPALSNAAELLAQTVSLTVSTESDAGTEEWNIEYLIPGATLAWTSGSALSVKYSRGSLPNMGSVTWSLLLSGGQEADLYVAGAGSVGGLENAPFTLSQADPVCSATGQCGSWRGYALTVWSLGAQQLVPYGEAAEVFGYRIVNGGIASVASSACSDWSVAGATVAMTRQQAS